MSGFLPPEYLSRAAISFETVDKDYSSTPLGSTWRYYKAHRLEELPDDLPHHLEHLKAKEKELTDAITALDAKIATLEESDDPSDAHLVDTQFEKLHQLEADLETTVETRDYLEKNPDGYVVYPIDDVINDGRFEGPGFNEFYPLPIEPKNQDEIRDIAIRIADLPLCLIEADDEETAYGLALTGGGMDFGWQIAEAYMRLGFLPPCSLTSLPSIVNRGTSPRDAWIQAGCDASRHATL